jgi:hypothetical protein
VELVIPVLKNLTYPRCEPAVSLLGRLKDQRAVEPLMERLREAEERGARVLADLQVVTGGKLELGSPSWSDLTRKRLKPEDAARFSALLRELSELDSGNLTITDNLRALIGPVSKSPQEWLDWWEQNKERFRKN